MRIKSSIIFNIILAVSLLLFPFGRSEGMQSGNYIIEKDSINFSGTDESASANYKLSDTMGEVGTGEMRERCSSLDFDGAGDYADMGNGSSLNITSAITISAWIKPGVIQEQYIVAKYPGDDVLSGYNLLIADNELYFRLGDGALRHQLNLTGGLSAGSWYHIAATWDGSTMLLYKDGSQISGSTSFVGTMGTNSNNVAVGSRAGSSYYWNGSIDDVRIYNRALSSTEVSDLYNGISVNSTGLAGYWNLNEGSGTVANDLSGNGNNGTIYDATYSADFPEASCEAASIGYRQDETAAESTISISSPSDVTMSPSFGGITGGVGNGSAAWTVTTDNAAGYQLSVKASTSPALKAGAYTFADYVPGGSAPDYAWSVASTASEFGYSVEGTHAASKFLDNGSACATGSGNTTDKCWLGFSTSDEAIATSSQPNDPAGTATTLKFRAEAGNERMQQPGDYVATVVVTAVAL